MPYRVFLGQIDRAAARYLRRARRTTTNRPQQFLRDLNLIADSLRANKGEHAGLFQRAAPHPPRRHFRLSPGDARYAPERASAHRRVIAQGLGRSALVVAHARASAQCDLREALERDDSAGMRARCARQAQLCGCSRRITARPSSLRHRRHRSYVVSGAQRRRRHARRPCCWRAGPMRTTAARAMCRLTSRRCSSPSRRCARCGEVMTQLFDEPAVSPAPRSARGRPPVRADRLLGQQQGKRHRHVALAAAQRAGSPVRGCRSGGHRPDALPRPGRRRLARRRAHRSAGAQRSRWRASRASAHHGAGRAHQREVRLAPDRLARLRAGFQCA